MKKFAILSLLLALFLTFFIGKNVLAIGQVTAPIIIKNVLRGLDVTATLNIFNSKDEEVIYGLSAEGDIAEWTSFYKIDDRNLKDPITEVNVPAKIYQNVTVKFAVPVDMPNGEYKGKIYIFTKPKDDDSASDISINVGQRVGRNVSITITDEEIFDFNTTIIPLKYEVKLGEPVIIKGIYENKGNVLVKPNLHFKILKDKREVFNAIFPFSEDEEPIRALERRIFPELIKWQTTGQEKGHYQGEIDVIINDKVFQKKSFRFSIIDDKVNVLGWVQSKINMNIIWYGFLALVLILIALVIIFSYKKKKARA